MIRTAALFAAAIMIAPPAIAQHAIPTKPVVFMKGASSTTVRGTIRGGASVDHILNARAGQTLSVKMTTSNVSAHFNLVQPGEEAAAFHIGLINGHSFTGPVPESGNMKIRVHLPGDPAAPDETADYTLSVILTGKGADGF